MRKLLSLVVLSGLSLGCTDSNPNAPTPAVPIQLATGAAPNVRLGVTVSDAGSRIRSDGSGEYIDGVAGVSSYIDGVGNLHFNPGGTSRSLIVDFSVQVSGAPFTPVPNTGLIQMLNQTNGAVLPEPKLTDLAVGTSACYPVSFGYQTATTQTRMFFHSTTENYAASPSIYGYITRTSPTTWTVVSNGSCPGTADLAGVTYNPDTRIRKGPTLTGYFSLPFSMTLRAL